MEFMIRLIILQVKMVVSSTNNNFERIRVNLWKSLPTEKNVDF